jgi:hypothetical protein
MLLGKKHHGSDSTKKLKFMDTSFLYLGQASNEWVRRVVKSADQKTFKVEVIDA